jgi:uncharacterized Zn finger protein (UPF0148 family)
MNHCDYCSSPIFDSKNMGTYISNLCERHSDKMSEMERDEVWEKY